MKLKKNVPKSAVASPQERKFLVFTLPGGKGLYFRDIVPESLQQFRPMVRRVTHRNWLIIMMERGQRLALYLRGWKGCFGFCETTSVFRDLGSWIRRRLGCGYWKQWKVYRCLKSELV